MSGYLYAGESDGGRIVRVGGSALTQVTTSGTESVLPVWTTWDAQPQGPSGDCVFRSVVVTIEYSNGYSVRVTPYVDGTALAAQTFSGTGADKTSLTAWVKSRGSRMYVKVEALSRTGDLELENVVAWFVPIRSFP